MKPATELIHAGGNDRGSAAPLTTPIYETTTFVFDNAQEVVAYNEGRSAKYLYSPTPNRYRLLHRQSSPGCQTPAGLHSSPLADRDQSALVA